MKSNNQGSSFTQENIANKQGTSFIQKNEGDQEIIEENQGSSRDQQNPATSQTEKVIQGTCQSQGQVDNSQMIEDILVSLQNQITSLQKFQKKKGYGKKICKILLIVGTVLQIVFTIGLIFFMILQNQSQNDQNFENYSQFNQLYENDQIQKKNASLLSHQIAENDSQINDLYSDIKTIQSNQEQIQLYFNDQISQKDTKINELNQNIQTIQSKYAQQFYELTQNFTKILSYPNSTVSQILSAIDMQKRIDLQSDQQKQFKAELYPMKEEWDIFKNDPSIIVKSWTEQFSDLKNDNAQFKNSTSSEMQKLRDTFTYTVKPLNSTIEQLQIQTLTLQTKQTNTDQALTKTTNDLSTFKTSSNQFQQDQTTINSKLDSFYKFQENSVEILPPFYSPTVWSNAVSVNGNGYVKLDKFQSMTGTVGSKTLISVTLIAHVNLTGVVNGKITILNNSQSRLVQNSSENEQFGSGFILNNTWNPMSLFFQYIVEKGQSYDFAIGVDTDKKNISATVYVHGPSVFITKQKIYTP